MDKKELVLKKGGEKMEKVNHKQLALHIRRAYETKIPIFVHGVAGSGKSDSVRDCAIQLAKDLKLEFTENGKEDEKTFGFRDVRLSQMESVDLRGVPKIEDGKTKWFIPEWFPQNPKSHGILFFDEYNTAFISVQNSSLELILNRRMGAAKLPDGWVVVCAGNVEGEQAHINMMSAPLRSRFSHFELQTPDVKSWSSWASEHGVSPHIVAFLNFKPQYLYKFEEDNRTESFPNPRSWYFSSRKIEGINDMAFIEREIASCVGKGVAIEFSSWYKMQEKVDLDAIVKNPELVTKVKEISLKYAVVSGLSEKYKSEKKILEPLLEVCKLIEPEFGFILLGYLRSTDKMAFAKIVTTKTWKEVASKYGKYLD